MSFIHFSEGRGQSRRDSVLKAGLSAAVPVQQSSLRYFPQQLMHGSFSIQFGICTALAFSTGKSSCPLPSVLCRTLLLVGPMCADCSVAVQRKGSPTSTSLEVS
jgi:hypothetical protein